ncbi:hypothetical protein [uncultured Treponema sp.]|uniref:hypothetical protein n=1 Tax=uncultured Treponema sp. TaxID=162155 RepID=UPI0025D3506F|nr:hypothetical protein [uncultured Treponema sp.]
MKKVCKLSLSVAISLILTAGFFSCSDAATEDHKNESSEKVCSVGGKLDLGSALPSELVPSLYGAKNASRSATSSFETDLNYRLYAYHLKESQDVTGATVYEHASDEYQVGSVDKNEMTWSVVLNQIGKWEIEITLWHDFDNDSSSAVYILRGTNIVSVDELDFGSSMECENVSLKPWADTRISGSINLAITVPDEVTSVSFTSAEQTETETPVISGTSTVSSNKAVITATKIPAGTYNVTFVFHKTAGDSGVYSCKETINVLSGFTTDTWYGTAPYFMMRENSSGGMDTSFVLSEDLLKSYKSSQTVAADEYPIVLYDRDHAKKGKEFENPAPGLNVFTTLSPNAKIGDGMTLADGKISQIKDFAIDPATQKIYTLEETAKGELRKIVEYPSYAGYAIGKTYAQNFTSDTISATFETFTVYNGEVYAYSSINGSIFKTVDGKFTRFPMVDESGSDLTMPSPMRSVKLAAYGKYLYMTFTGGASDTGYSLYVKKFEVSGTNLKQVASLEKNFTDLGIYGVTDGEYQLEDYSYLDITDIQPNSTGTELYILASEHVYEYHGDSYRSESRGGIIKITNTETETTSGGATVVNHALALHDFKASGATESVWIYGWTYGAWYPVDDSSSTVSDTKYFYGCSKFLAKKPDELVIADEGGYEYDENKRKNKNRVVTVNLATFAMQSIVDVDAGFDWWVKADPESGYGGYSNGSDYSTCGF